MMWVTHAETLLVCVTRMLYHNCPPPEACSFFEGFLSDIITDINYGREGYQYQVLYFQI